MAPSLNLGVFIGEAAIYLGNQGPNNDAVLRNVSARFSPNHGTHIEFNVGPP